MYFHNLNRFGKAPAVFHPEGETCYARLDELVHKFKEHFPAHKQLVILKADNDLYTLVSYLACLQAGHTMLLVAEELSDDKLRVLIDSYRPNFLINDHHVTQLNDNVHQIDEDCALLLSTSGSTGTAKQVALSYENLQHNAASISGYLPIEASDKAMMTLPLYYSYGLSVLNSHLLNGASVVFTPFTFVNRQWWDLLERLKITSFAGVPHSYEMLLRLRLTTKPLPFLRYFTQAGGKLDPQHVNQLGQYACENGKQFFVMYGQTEATARMAYLSPEQVLDKPQSIGQAIPGGQLRLIDELGKAIEQTHAEGELEYTGPNVMLGYTESLEDLASFKPSSTLLTGDLAVKDKDGDFYIKGRKKRFVKIFGQRLGLDEIETLLAQRGITCYCCGNDEKLVIATDADSELDIKKLTSKIINLHPSAIDLYYVESLPINSNGKKDYHAIMTLAGMA